MKLLNNLRKKLNDDRLLYRIAFCGIIIGMIFMYLSVVGILQTITDEVRIGLIQQENIVCSPLYNNDDGILRFVCEVPDRDFVRDTLYK